MKLFLLILVIAGAIAALAFVLTKKPSPGDTAVRVEDVSLKSLESLSPEDWKVAAGKRVFFGHQSVGSNILAGFEEIAKQRPEFALRVVHGGAEALADGPGLAETGIGANQDPESKIRDFVAQVRKEGARFDVAFLKLCYVEVRQDTDAKALFESYRKAMAGLAKDVPGTRLMHCTVPLTTISTNWKSRLKRILGKEPGPDADNRVRQDFNQLMRAEYENAGTLIDIALGESTLPDGTKLTWKTGKQSYPCLAACYSDDGGHLGAVGRRALGQLVLRRLALLCQVGDGGFRRRYSIILRALGSLAM